MPVALVACCQGPETRSRVESVFDMLVFINITRVVITNKIEMDNLNIDRDRAQCEKATDTLLRLTEPINNFFDKVLVMDKDEAVRNNRLALLGEIWQIVSSLADFSKLDERT